ncbi:hypothetical protein [Salmonella enterica]|uniref:hypothetical protein n=1 Tax=Salmonella enterica TaxID=28901 RepID=UPI000D01C1B2|nr:hypothetical protein [Salmonella enterica]
MTTENNREPPSIALETIDIGNVENQLGDADFDIAKERFALAKDILLYLFCLLVFLIIVRILPENINNNEIKELFNTIFQSIVPIASLIIGYYFGSKGTKE